MKTILALILIQLCPAFSIESLNDKDFRLPPYIIPYNYYLTVVTHLGDMDKFSFYGHVNITIASKERNVRVIKIHSKDLDIPDESTRITHVSNSQNVVKIVDDKFDTVNDFYIIYLDKPLIVNSRYILSISFSGILTDSRKGYYRTSYIDAKTGARRWLAVTQFQPTYARSAFPCFDEPSFKATFKISLIHVDKYTSVSNMPLLLSEEIEPGWVKNTFMLTEKMSTYTLAYAVSDFIHLDIKPRKNEPLIRVWSRPDAINQTIVALTAGNRLLKYYENYFQILYPLPKLDLFAVPDLMLSGMENWGLIFCRDDLLLTDTEIPNELPHIESATLLSHEIAHMWFGNLVTMKWWNEIWLNEGFASHMESKAVDYLVPHRNILSSDTLGKVQTIFDRDGSITTHPVSVPIYHPDQIVQVFDDISYKKGSILIRMMNVFLGEEAFRSGLSHYLRELSYLNAEKDDLWHYLTIHAHMLGTIPENTSVNEIMDPWVLQTGYPVVTVTRDYKHGTIRLNQRKYSLSQAYNKTKSSDCWNIPISYTTRKTRDFRNTKPRIWLTCENNDSIFVTEAGKDDWIILNLQLSGLYRVQYDLYNWNLIKNALHQNHASIDALNRAQIILDVFDLTWTGNLEYKMAVNIISYLVKEKNYFPWKIVLDEIQKLYVLMKHLNMLTPFREFVTNLMEPIYEEWSDFGKKYHSDDLQSPVFHVAILNTACKLNIFNCASKAKQIFNELLENNIYSSNVASKKLIPIILCNGVREGGTKEWEFLWNHYLNFQNNDILNALTCTRKRLLLERLLNFAHTEGSGIRERDRVPLFKAIAIDNDVGYSVAKNFFMDNIDKLFSLYKYHEIYLGLYLQTLAQPMMTDLNLYEISSFININYKYLQYSSTQLEATMDTIKQNMEWYKHRYNNFLSAIDESNKNKFGQY